MILISHDPRPNTKYLFQIQEEKLALQAELEQTKKWTDFNNANEKFIIRFKFC